MKKLLMILLVAGIFSTEYASAQHRGGGVYIRPRTTVVVGGGYYSPFYPYGYLGLGYPYYGYPSVAARPSKLDQEIEDITHDYAQKIESVRMDTSITGKDRRHQIRELKEARDRDIDLARRDYHNQ